MRLDDNDLKILDLLSINSKLKIKEIAGKLKMKNATAAYHLGKINGITTKKAIINNYLIGSSQFKLFIKLMDFEDKTKNEIEQFSMQCSEVNKVSHINGTFDLVIHFEVMNHGNFTDYYELLIEKYGNKIIYQEITIPTRSTRIMGNRFRTNQTKIIMIKPCKPIEVTDNEIKILRSINPLKNIKKLNSLTGLDDKTIRKYIKKMEKKKIILGYTIDVGTLDTEYEKYIVRFSCKDKKTLKNFLGKTQGVTYIEEAMSKWDLEVNITTKSHSQLSQIIKTAKKNVPALTKYEVMYVEKEMTNIRK